MASIDVDSSFINIILDETIDICINSLWVCFFINEISEGEIDNSTADKKRLIINR